MGHRFGEPFAARGVDAVAGHAGEARAEVIGECLRSARRVDVGRLDQAVGAVVTVGPTLARQDRDPQISASRFTLCPVILIVLQTNQMIKLIMILKFRLFSIYPH